MKVNKGRYFWNGRFSGIMGAIYLVFIAGVGKIFDLVSSLMAKSNFRYYGKNLKVHKGVTYRYPGNIKLGNDVVLARNSELYSENPEGQLIIGDNVIITFGVRLDFSGNLSIGNNSLISKNTIIETHDHGLDPFSSPTFHSLVIGENVWIGMNCIILSGVKSIGNNSVIAAGAVVTKEVPPNVVVAGCPGRIIKNLDNIDGERR